MSAWRARYGQAGIEGVADLDRSGRPRQVGHRTIVAATLRQPANKLGVSHWSSLLLAVRLGVDHSTVAKAWEGGGEYGVAPWREGIYSLPPTRNW